MKKIALFILAVVLAGVAAIADTHYLCWTGGNNSLNFAKIPGPGEHSTLNLVHSIPIGFNSDAVTYDGENWWVYKYSTNELYCFDQNGDFVRSFPLEGAASCNGLAWDGEYLWIVGSYTYSKDIYGNDGPYPTFYTFDAALTVVGDKLLSGSDSAEFTSIAAHDFYGNFLFWGAHNEGYTDCGFPSLAYHDGIVWTEMWYNDSSEYHYDIVGFYYDDDGDWDWYAIVYDYYVRDLGICDADFINIAESSLGNIKAYFATEEMKGE